MSIEVIDFSQIKTRYRFALCFFGLTRSLKYTIESIKTNIFTILKKKDIDYDIYLHTYDKTHITSKRSNEFNVPLDTNEYLLLNPDFFKITNQDDFFKFFNFNEVKRYGDSWNTNFENTYNAMAQLNSLKEVTNLWIDQNKYDFYLYLRPDLLYIDPLPIDEILKNITKENIIFTPDWQLSNNYVNDRFAYGSYDSMIKYGLRINDLFEYMPKSKKPYNSELFLNFIIKKYNIHNLKIKTKAKRVRATGKIHDEKFY